MYVSTQNLEVDCRVYYVTVYGGLSVQQGCSWKAIMDQCLCSSITHILPARMKVSDVSLTIEADTTSLSFLFSGTMAMS